MADYGHRSWFVGRPDDLQAVERSAVAVEERETGAARAELDRRAREAQARGQGWPMEQHPRTDRPASGRYDYWSGARRWYGPQGEENRAAAAISRGRTRHEARWPRERLTQPPATPQPSNYITGGYRGRAAAPPRRLPGDESVQKGGLFRGTSSVKPAGKGPLHAVKALYGKLFDRY